MTTTVVPLTTDVPAVGPQDDGQGPIIMPLKVSPWSFGWWTAQVITNIPAESVGWLVAQGWQITAVTNDDTTVPPTPSYAMARQTLQNWMILQGLLDEWTSSYNLAVACNAIRYNDVVLSWGKMIDSSQLHFETEISEQNTHVTLFLGNLDTYMDEVDTLIDDSQTQIVADANKADAALEEANLKLADLETNVTVATGEIETLLNNQSSYLSTFLTQFANEMAELDTNYTAALAAINALIVTMDGNLTSFISTINTLLTTILADYTILEGEIDALLVTDASTLGAHVTDYNAVLALLESDYSLHAVTATAFLDDLGATETARIAEKFTGLLSTQMQQLVDRGLYSSGLAADVTARNGRDHNEEIGALNDRLMREKWENQHRLYGQQVDMRKDTMGGKDRMYALRQELSKYHAAQITGVYGLLQDVRNRTMATKQTIVALQDAASRYTIEVRTALLTNLNGIVAQQAAGLDRKYTAQIDVSRVEMTERERILGMLNDAVKALVAGKESYSAAKMQKASMLAENRNRVIVAKMSEAAARLSGLDQKHQEDMKLMAYQLEERNKLLVGIYGFVERREDVGPGFDELAKVCAGLGDSGGGWITP